MNISIDFSGAGVPIVTGEVSDGYDNWYESVQLIGYYCESDDHVAENCECGSDDQLIDGFIGNISARGLDMMCDFCVHVRVEAQDYLRQGGVCHDCFQSDFDKDSYTQVCRGCRKSVRNDYMDSWTDVTGGDVCYDDVVHDVVWGKV